MQYLNKSFTIPSPSKVMPGTCEACVWGGRGDHSLGCVAVPTFEATCEIVKESLEDPEMSQEFLRSIGHEPAPRIRERLNAIHGLPA